MSEDEAEFLVDSLDPVEHQALRVTLSEFITNLRNIG